MLKEMNDVMSYIEANLAEELNLDEHIPKMIRKRRMTIACYDLRERNMKVIDVAVKFGF